MNTKLILGIVTLGILAISSLGSASAAENGLWMSRNNNLGDHGSLNYVLVDSCSRVSSNGDKTAIGNPTYDEYGLKMNLGKTAGRGFYFRYPGESAKEIELQFKVIRVSWNFDRTLYFNVTLPVYGNNWLLGVSSTQGGIGMRFSADNHYPGVGEEKMDTVHCFLDNYEIFKCPGGKFHEGQTFTAEFNNPFPHSEVTHS